MLEALKTAGWNPVVLSPPADSHLPQTGLRGLMGRLAACDAIIGPSTGPLHLAAAMDVPTLCLMGKRVSHGPDRWAPLGSRVETLQYPAKADDLGHGMDSLDMDSVLGALGRLR